MQGTVEDKLMRTGSVTGQ